MNTTSAEYLNLVKSKQNLKNQNQLAIYFGVTRSSINHYYSGKRKFDTTMIFKVSEALDISMKEITINIEKEAAKTPEVKKFWEKKLESLVALYVIGVAIPLLISENWTFFNIIPKIPCFISKSNKFKMVMPSI